jgi:hypothetical protein
MRPGCGRWPTPEHMMLLSACITWWPETNHIRRRAIASFYGTTTNALQLPLADDFAYWPAMPLFTRTLTSTRRFSARPCAVSLAAAGSAVPIAPGATTCRTGTLQSWIK